MAAEEQRPPGDTTQRQKEEVASFTSPGHPKKAPDPFTTLDRAACHESHCLINLLSSKTKWPLLYYGCSIPLIRVVLC